MKYIKLLLLIILFFSCKSTNEIIYDKTVKKLSINKFKDKINWQHLDLERDSVLGVSLNKAYEEIIHNKKGNEITVAVIDSYIDIKHPSLKNMIWINKKEIANNGIDDDNNGYIDDLHGWNFLGSSNGKTTAFLNNDATRTRRKLIKKYSKDTITFNGNKQDSVSFHKSNNLIKKARKSFLSRKEDEAYYKDMLSKSFKTLKSIFPNGKYSTKQLDSIYNHYEKKDTVIAYQAFFVKEILNIGCTDEWFELYYESVRIEEETTINPNFYDRDIIGDNEDDLEDSKYGNPNITAHSKIYPHSTYVSAIIAGDRNIKNGVHGLSNKIKIMPICILPYKGIMTDKDIYYAITYAVKNGAKVINMSFGKYNPIHPDWIKKAVLFAEENDVLLVVSAGNSKENLDTLSQYPNDYDNYEGQEFSNNLIVVAGNNKKLSKNLVLDFSNYGKKNVDLFAPADEIITIDPVSGVHIASGTTYAAALTSGVAALLRSYYPEFTAAQVKQILMDSSVKFDLMVQVPGEKEGVLKPFRELSKSGGVLNAYNAFKLAEQISKGQKK